MAKKISLSAIKKALALLGAFDVLPDSYYHHIAEVPPETLAAGIAALCECGFRVNADGGYMTVKRGRRGLDGQELYRWLLDAEKTAAIGEEINGAFDTMQSEYRYSMYQRFTINLSSANKKLLGDVVIRASHNTCPIDCPLRRRPDGERRGCYGEDIHCLSPWLECDKNGVGIDELAAIIRERVKPGRVIRYGEVGDLCRPNSNEIDPHIIDVLCGLNMYQWVIYTHAPLTAGNIEQIKRLYRAGIYANMSCHNYADAEKALRLGFNAVITMAGQDYKKGQVIKSGIEGVYTKVCPDKCSDCGYLCSKRRVFIVGFPAHGNSKKKTIAISAA